MPRTGLAHSRHTGHICSVNDCLSSLPELGRSSPKAEPGHRLAPSGARPRSTGGARRLSEATARVPIPHGATRARPGLASTQVGPQGPRAWHKWAPEHETEELGQDSCELREVSLLGQPVDQGPGPPHPSSAGSPGLGRAPGGRPCHCWGPRPRVPSCPGGFRTAHNGLARGAETQKPGGRACGRGQAGGARGRGQRVLGAGHGPRGSGRPEGALTRLHGAADDPQDVGGVPQLQAVVDTHVHLAWGAKGATRVLALPTPPPNPMQGKLRPRATKGHHHVSGPQVPGKAARRSPSARFPAPLPQRLIQRPKLFVGFFLCHLSDPLLLLLAPHPGPRLEALPPLKLLFQTKVYSVCWWPRPSLHPSSTPP